MRVARLQRSRAGRGAVAPVGGEGEGNWLHRPGGPRGAGNFNDYATGAGIPMCLCSTCLRLHACTCLHVGGWYLKVPCQFCEFKAQPP